MTNAEKRGKEILEQECRTGNWALNKYTNEICNCTIEKCRSCMFFDGDWACTNVKAKWLNSEYKMKKHFTEADKAVLRAFDKIQWVAKDYNDSVYGYIQRPYKNGLKWNVEDGAINFSVIQNISSATFTDIKWEDEEPTSREEILGEEK